MAAPELLTVDCRGMQCPAPILRIAKTAKEAKGKPLVLEVLADDADFPNDLRAWCRTSRATLHELADEHGAHRAIVGLNGAAYGAAVGSPPVMVAPSTSAPAPAQGGPRPLLDLRGKVAPAPLIELSAALVRHAGQTFTVQSDDPTFVTDVVTWAGATRTAILDSRKDGPTAVVSLRFPKPEGVADPRPSLPVPKAEPVEPSLASPPSVALVPRTNQCTLLILRNDFESLMAALLVATTSAAQGMNVVIFFSFWGVNLLRGERRRKTDESRVSFIQRLMKWMMPRGPKRQKLGKMNMGGMGKGLMELLMRRNNVMNIEQLLGHAVEQNVRFIVCTMSMGIMGIQKRDLLDLPNMEYAGVTLFVEQSRQSAMSLVF